MGSDGKSTQCMLSTSLTFHHTLFEPFTARLASTDVHSLQHLLSVPYSSLQYLEISMQTELVVFLPWFLLAMSGVTNDLEGFVESHIT